MLKAVTSVALGVGLTAVLAVPVQADPVNGEFRDLAGFGSNVSQGFMNDVSEIVVMDGTKPLASYSSEPVGELVSTKAESAYEGRCNTTGAAGGVQRQRDSIGGRFVLSNSQFTAPASSAIRGCVQYARSYGEEVSMGQTFIPVARDGLTYAYPAGSGIPKNMPLSILRGIYNCSIGTNSYRVYIPQAPSDLRRSWAAYMGINPDALPNCVKDVQPDGLTPVRENNASFMTGRDIMPYSIGAYIEQMYGTDTRGSAVIGAIGGMPPIQVNRTYGAKSDGSSGRRMTVGNIIPSWTNVPGTTEYRVFINDGSGKSAICSLGKSAIATHGFLPKC